MGHLPDYVLVMMRIYVKAMPILQPVLMVFQLLCALWSLYALVRLRRRLCHKICGTADVQLETVLNPHPNPNPTPLHDSPKAVKELLCIS